MNISVIIPAKNEADNIQTTLLQLNKVPPAEVILVDDKSTDWTSAVALRTAKTLGLNLQVVPGPGKGRGFALAAGAEKATSEVIVFLHADTILPKRWQAHIQKAIEKGKQAGGFAFRFDTPGLAYRLIALFSNTRARVFKQFHGDQTQWMLRSVYDNIGGIALVPLMEDVLLSRSWKKHGVKTTLIGTPSVTSARRIARFGIIKSTLRYIYLQTRFRLGASPEELAKLYRPQKRVKF